MFRRIAPCLLAAALLASCQHKTKHSEAPEAARKLNQNERHQFDQLTIRQIMQGPGITGTAPSDPQFSADGKTLYFHWNDPAPLDSMNATDPEKAYEHYLDLGFRAGTWRMDLASRKMEKLTRAAADTTKPDEIAWDRDRKRRAEIRNGDVYSVDAATGAARRLTETVDDESTVQIAPDGRTIYYTRAKQVYAVPFAGGLIRQVTNLDTSDDPKKTKPNPQRQFLIDQQKALFDEFKEHGPKKKESRPRKLHVGSGFDITRCLV
jgi:dipeptidyl-peptidase-4